MKIGDCKASCFLDDCVKQAMLMLRMFESMIGDHLKATKALICKRMTKKEAVEAQVNQFGSLVRGIVEEGGLIEQYRRCQLDRFKLTILDAAGQASVQGDRSGLAFYFAEAFTASQELMASILKLPSSSTLTAADFEGYLTSLDAVRNASQAAPTSQQETGSSAGLNAQMGRLKVSRR